MSNYLAPVRTVAIGCLLMAGCENTPVNPQQKLASALCECVGATKLIDLNKQAQVALADPARATELTGLLQSIDAEHTKFSICIEPAINAFGKVRSVEMASFMDQIGKNCPSQDSMIYTIAEQCVAK